MVSLPSMDGFMGPTPKTKTSPSRWPLSNEIHFWCCDPVFLRSVTFRFPYFVLGCCIEYIDDFLCNCNVASLLCSLYTHFFQLNFSSHPGVVNRTFNHLAHLTLWCQTISMIWPLRKPVGWEFIGKILGRIWEKWNNSMGKPVTIG